VTKRAHSRSILHLDLDPFIVSVERSLDPSLRGRAVIVGGGSIEHGFVAAASAEARAAGVQPGQTLARARRLCPDGIVRPGDLETYARFSDEITALLLARSRRVERPSSDEAYVDLTPETAQAPGPVAAAEAIKDEVQRRLGLDASLGLASSRLAARVASRWARPRGLLLVLPGYETSFLHRQSISFLPELPPHLEGALRKAGFESLGLVADADEQALAAVVGSYAAPRLQEAARGLGEPAVAVAAPPLFVNEETRLRARAADRDGLLAVLDGLLLRAWRRVQPFGLGIGSVGVEVQRGNEHADRRTETFEPALDSEDGVRDAVHAMAAPLLVTPAGVRGLALRLGRLASPDRQARLFPGLSCGPLRQSSLR
jgi:DNA polymerase-4